MSNRPAHLTPYSQKLRREMTAQERRLWYDCLKTLPIRVRRQHVLGDYIVAFSVLGLAGLFHNQEKGFFTGTVVGSFARFLVHYLVGVWVWGEYMPDTFFGMTMTTPWFYSFLYNGSYMIIDMVLCLVVGILLWKPMGKYLRGEDLRKA